MVNVYLLFLKAGIFRPFLKGRLLTSTVKRATQREGLRGQQLTVRIFLRQLRDDYLDCSECTLHEGFGHVTRISRLSVYCCYRWLPSLHLSLFRHLDSAVCVGVCGGGVGWRINGVLGPAQTSKFSCTKLNSYLGRPE